MSEVRGEEEERCLSLREGEESEGATSLCFVCGEKRISRIGVVFEGGGRREEDGTGLRERKDQQEEEEEDEEGNGNHGMDQGEDRDQEKQQKSKNKKNTKEKREMTEEFERHDRRGEDNEKKNKNLRHFFSSSSLCDGKEEEAETQTRCDGSRMTSLWRDKKMTENELGHSLSLMSSSSSSSISCKEKIRMASLPSSLFSSSFSPNEEALLSTPSSSSTSTASSSSSSISSCFSSSFSSSSSSASSSRFSEKRNLSSCSVASLSYVSSSSSSSSPPSSLLLSPPFVVSESAPHSSPHIRPGEIDLESSLAKEASLQQEENGSSPPPSSPTSSSLSSPMNSVLPLPSLSLSSSSFSSSSASSSPLHLGSLPSSATTPSSSSSPSSSSLLFLPFTWRHASPSAGLSREKERECDLHAPSNEISPFMPSFLQRRDNELDDNGRMAMHRPEEEDEEIDMLILESVLEQERMEVYRFVTARWSSFLGEKGLSSLGLSFKEAKKEEKATPEKREDQTMRERRRRRKEGAVGHGDEVRRDVGENNEIEKERRGGGEEEESANSHLIAIDRKCPSSYSVSRCLSREEDSRDCRSSFCSYGEDQLFCVSRERLDQFRGSQGKTRNEGKKMKKNDGGDHCHSSSPSSSSSEFVSSFAGDRIVPMSFSSSFFFFFFLPSPCFSSLPLWMNGCSSSTGRSEERCDTLRLYSPPDSGVISFLSPSIRSLLLVSKSVNRRVSSLISRFAYLDLKEFLLSLLPPPPRYRHRRRSSLSCQGGDRGGLFLTLNSGEEWRRSSFLHRISIASGEGGLQGHRHVEREEEKQALSGRGEKSGEMGDLETKREERRMKRRERNKEEGTRQEEAERMSSALHRITACVCHDDLGSSGVCTPHLHREVSGVCTPQQLPCREATCVYTSRNGEVSLPVRTLQCDEGAFSPGGVSTPHDRRRPFRIFSSKAGRQDRCQVYHRSKASPADEPFLYRNLNTSQEKEEESQESFSSSSASLLLPFPPSISLLVPILLDKVDKKFKEGMDLGDPIDSNRKQGGRSWEKDDSETSEVSSSSRETLKKRKEGVRMTLDFVLYVHSMMVSLIWGRRVSFEVSQVDRFVNFFSSFFYFRLQRSRLSHLSFCSNRLVVNPTDPRKREEEEGDKGQKKDHHDLNDNSGSSCGEGVRGLVEERKREKEMLECKEGERSYQIRKRRSHDKGLEGWFDQPRKEEDDDVTVESLVSTFLLQEAWDNVSSEERMERRRSVSLYFPFLSVEKTKVERESSSRRDDIDEGEGGEDWCEEEELREGGGEEDEMKRSQGRRRRKEQMPRKLLRKKTKNMNSVKMKRGEVKLHATPTPTGRRRETHKRGWMKGLGKKASHVAMQLMLCDFQMYIHLNYLGAQQSDQHGLHDEGLNRNSLWNGKSASPPRDLSLSSMRSQPYLSSSSLAKSNSVVCPSSLSMLLPSPLSSHLSCTPRILRCTILHAEKPLRNLVSSSAFSRGLLMKEEEDESCHGRASLSLGKISRSRQRSFSLHPQGWAHALIVGLGAGEGQIGREQQDEIEREKKTGRNEETERGETKEELKSRDMQTKSREKRRKRRGREGVEKENVFVCFFLENGMVMLNGRLVEFSRAGAAPERRGPSFHSSSTCDGRGDKSDRETHKSLSSSFTQQQHPYETISIDHDHHSSSSSSSSERHVGVSFSSSCSPSFPFVVDIFTFTWYGLCERSLSSDLIGKEEKRGKKKKERERRSSRRLSLEENLLRVHSSSSFFAGCGTRLPGPLEEGVQPDPRRHVSSLREKRNEEGERGETERDVYSSCIRGSSYREGLIEEDKEDQPEMKREEEEERRDRILHSYRAGGLLTIPSSSSCSPSSTSRSDGYRFSSHLQHGFSMKKREEISISSSLSTNSSFSSSPASSSFSSSSSSSSFSPFSDTGARQHVEETSPHPRDKSSFNKEIMDEQEEEEEEISSERIRQSHVAFVFLSSDGGLYVSGDVPGILISSREKREAFMKQNATVTEERRTLRRDVSLTTKRGEEDVKNLASSPKRDLEKEKDPHDDMDDDMVRILPSSSGCIYRGYPLETSCCLTGECLSFSSILTVNSASLALSSGILLPRHRRDLKKRREERSSSSLGDPSERRRQGEAHVSSSLLSPPPSCKPSHSYSFHTWLKASYIMTKRVILTKQKRGDQEDALLHEETKKQDQQDEEEEEISGVYTPGCCSCRFTTTTTPADRFSCACASHRSRGEDNLQGFIERRREQEDSRSLPFSSSLSVPSSSSVSPADNSSFSTGSRRGDGLSLRDADHPGEKKEKEEEEDESLYCPSLLEDKNFTERGVLAILQTHTGDLVFMTIKDDGVRSIDQRKEEREEEEEREGGGGDPNDPRKEGEDGEHERERQRERLSLCMIPEIARRPRGFSGGGGEEEEKRERRSRRERRVLLGFKCLSRFDLLANLVKQKEQEEEEEEKKKKRRMMIEAKGEGERRDRKEKEEDNRGAKDRVSEDDVNELGKMYEKSSSSSLIFPPLSLSSSRGKREEGGEVAREEEEEELSSLNFERRGCALRKFLQGERWIAGCLYTEIILLKTGDVSLQEETSASLFPSGPSIRSRFLLLSTLDDEQHRWLAHFFETHLHLVNRIQTLRLGFERLTSQQCYSQLLLQRRQREEEEERQKEVVKKEATISTTKKKKNFSCISFKKDLGRWDPVSLDKMAEAKGESNGSGRRRRRRRRGERERYLSTDEDGHLVKERRDSMKKEEEKKEEEREEERREGENRHGTVSIEDKKEEEEGDGLFKSSDGEATKKKKKKGEARSHSERGVKTNKRRRRRYSIEGERRRLCSFRQKVKDGRRKRKAQQQEEEAADESCFSSSSSCSPPSLPLSFRHVPFYTTSQEEEEEEEEEKFLYKRGRGLLDWEEDDGELRLFFNTWKGRRRRRTFSLSLEEEEEEMSLFFVLNLHRKCLEMIWDSSGKFHFIHRNVLLATSHPPGNPLH
ncbi:hypothetical protein CSUI_003253 [Cystoisospora suis]|uniref:Uncharacterized protein n=1 Tax=Cystoisospora suis TaxID=483139 RepID=A0A2C6L5M2_9APIC|nr:hypothetical protein CSUI_003253 [Cystoisospora suis]